MTELHMVIRPMSPNADSVAFDFRGHPMTRYSLPPDAMKECFPRSYESLEKSLAVVPRLYIEPDGSFVWVSPENPDEKLSGQITDDGHHVMYIELRATCGFDGLEPLLSALGWPDRPLLFQVLPEAVLLDESGVRHFLRS